MSRSLQSLLTCFSRSYVFMSIIKLIFGKILQVVCYTCNLRKVESATVCVCVRVFVYACVCVCARVSL